MYLENIFVGSEDIRPHLPQESVWFDEVNHQFTEVMQQMYVDRKAVDACKGAYMLDALNEFINKLEKIQKSLDDYLEKKRQLFPRFYFISNDDLLEILGQARDPEAVQKHMKKCFEGIKTLQLTPPSKEKNQKSWEAVGMNAPDGEAVKLYKTVILEAPVEGWLIQIEKRMKETLRKILCDCHKLNIAPKGMKKEKWVREYPGMLLITSGQIAWTHDCESALQKIDRGSKNAMKVLKKAQGKYISKLTDIVRKPLTKVERGKLVSLITIEVHARDVQDRMIVAKTESPLHFNWLSQLRFQLRDPGEGTDAGSSNMVCYVMQTNTLSAYGYEYQGNNGRLVITPMTDRCFMTLTTALHLKRGGAPQGPAGTGKTESVKDLGKGLAKYVLVFNCSDGLDYKSLGRMFSGLAQSGSWGCFDEFNRIEVEVLSVVAAQILTIQAALKDEKEKFLFEDRMIRIDKGCAVFITMNPGYAGRSELPDNLKSLFRPVAMMVPELHLICEIMLVSEGFKDFKVLAKKMTTLYAMMMQQMSKQDHYDFGLRNIKSVLGCAGNIKRSDPELPEPNMVMKAINDMNLPKWVAQDVPLYTALLGDVFPGLELPNPSYGALETAIKKSLTDKGLQLHENCMKKVIQTYETKITRHGNMLVGFTNGGKSVAWKTLQEAKTALCKDGIEGFEKVHVNVINPKSITMDQLYGAFDLATMEWTDGILSSIMRVFCQDEKPDEKWLMLDGPVDTLWIESMNTVLDDNKILTLINGDRISMTPSVSLLFEVGDLSVASPATVSRAGMVYFDPPDLGWLPYATSWVQAKVKEPHKQFVQDLFEKYVDRLFKAKKPLQELVKPDDTNCVVGLCNLFESIQKKIGNAEYTPEQIEKVFAFSAVWSIGAGLTGNSRAMFDAALKEIDSSFPPSQTSYDYALNYEKGDWQLWEEKLPNPFRPPEGAQFNDIIVPTVDTIRNSHIFHMLAMNHYHVLLVGNTGTGKTVAAQQEIATLDETAWTSCTLNCSAQTSSEIVQGIIEGRVEKRIKNKFGPPGNRRMMLFVDDMNMPRKDTFGSQPPLELIRQWMDYESWYDREKQTLRYILDMQVVGGMGKPGGGRAVISGRYQAQFHLINFADPTEVQVKRIYSTLCGHKLQDFSEDVKAQVEPLTAASLQVFNAICDKFLPTPAKCHYLFNLRDVSKVFQGLYWAEKHLFEEKEAIFRVWTHENFRVYMDRLIDIDDRNKFRTEVDSIMEANFQVRIKEYVAEGEDLTFAKIDLKNPEAEDASYDFFADKNALKAFCQQKLEDYNDCVKGKAMTIVLFKDALEHCFRILRIIQLARGNALLVGVGGSGRHCQSRLASFIADYKCFNIEIDKNYKHPAFREDLKKVYEQVGVKDLPLTFLFSDTEIVTESFLEDVSNALQSGEVPNLFLTDEQNAIRSGIEKPAKAAGVPYGPEPLWDFFLTRVRKNLHIVFCMSPIGEGFRNYCRMYPSLVNATTIDWFLPWPKEALAEVSLTFLQASDVTQETREALASVFGIAHVAVAEVSAYMQRVEKRNNYVTPTAFINLVQGYVKTLGTKQEEIGNNRDKLANGLYKLNEARSQVEELTVDLEGMQDVVAKRTKECQELLVVIVEKKMQADEKQRTLEVDNQRLAKEEAEIMVIATDAERDVAKAMPALEAAVDALEKLDKKSIAEVKAYAKPPELVLKTMNAVMTVMDKPATWASAKNELQDVNFLQRLKTFDKDHISNSTLKKMEKYTKDSTFQPQTVQNVSKAAGALCMWVHAMKMYAEVYREVEPKRLKLKKEKEKLQKKLDEKASAEAELRGVLQMVNDLQTEADDKEREKDELTATAEELKEKLQRAAALVDGLAGEKVRWEISVTKFDSQITNLVGDCMIAAAFLSYAGPFGAVYRQDLVENRWVQPVKEFQLPFSSDFTFASADATAGSFMAKATDVRDWNMQGLPTDNFSTENGVLCTASARWSLMIDPQTQGNRWTRKKEAPNDLKVLDPNTKDFMRTIERAIEWGKPVLMENVKEDLDPSLDPILQKNLMKSGNSYSIKIGDNTLDYNMNFKFIMTTKMSNPHYTPEVSAKCTIVNFIVVLEGLTDQLLGVVVQLEEPILEEQNQELVIKISTGKNKLVELENEILRLLAESQGSLLDDINLINTLAVSKETSVAVQEQLDGAEEKKEKIKKAREEYIPCGLRSAVLFFVLNDMVSIDVMYQFSLEAYITLFKTSIERYAEKNPMATGEERIDLLNQYHQRAVYRYACRGLFERHKLLLSMHLASKVLMANKDFNSVEYAFFLRGGQVLDRSSQPPNPAPEWITQQMWDNLVEVEKLENFRGFQTTFEQTLRDWRKWFMSAEPETEPLPGEWDARLDALQKMIVTRCIRTDRTLPAIEQFITQRLSPEFVEPPAFDLESVFEESTNTIPTLFVLTPGMDPTPLLRALANAHNTQWQTISLGQGQAPKAQKLMSDAAEQGFWAFLANCHLSSLWLPTLEKIVANMSEELPHPAFRLWMSSDPSPKFPISLLQLCVKVTTEPPRSLKSNMTRLLNQVTDEHFNRVKEHNKYKRLFMSLVWMHSLLLERKKFKTLGWNVAYDFNDSDFDINENILAMYLDEYPNDIPWEAIRYLISEANYGGRVTEQPDNRLIRVYANDFFCPQALQPKFQLSSLPEYYIPEDGNLQVYRQYCKELPLTEKPEAFGQHVNAAIASLIVDADNLLGTLIGIQGAGGGGGGGGDGASSADKQVMATCDDLLVKVPEPIDWDDIAERNQQDVSPQKVCLLQEIERYNGLLVRLRATIKELIRGIQGFVVISEDQEKVYDALLNAKVPAAWLFAYPSVKPMAGWLIDLIARIEQLTNWGMYGAPKIFWLAGFTYPSSFLTALLQFSARKLMVSVDTLSFDYLPQGFSEDGIQAAPKEGAMIKNMILEGGRWDINNQCLTEPEPMALFAPMPITHFKPIQKKKGAADGVYQCPLYMYPVRTGTRERPSFITWVEVKSGTKDHAFWTRRGTALLLATA
jgi:dynein heavy chain